MHGLNSLTRGASSGVLALKTQNFCLDGSPIRHAARKLNAARTVFPEPFASFHPASVRNHPFGLRSVCACESTVRGRKSSNSVLFIRLRRARLMNRPAQD